MVNSRQKGAAYERHVADVVDVPYLHIECKAVERLNLYDAIAQAKRDARDGEIPIVIHKKNYCADLVTMEFTEWIKLYKEWEAGQ